MKKFVSRNPKGSKHSVFPFPASFRLLLIALLGIAMLACDPAQSIIVANKTDFPVRVTFVFKEGSHLYHFYDEYDDRDSDTLVLELDSSRQNNFRAFDFGIGTWKVQGAIDSLVAAVESIEIETPERGEDYRGESQLKAFFESRVQGGQNQLIEILIE